MGASNLKREFIENELSDKAWEIAYNYVRHWPAGPSKYNDFRKYEYFNKDGSKNYPKWKINKNGGVSFIFNKYAYLGIKNVRPAKVKSINFGPVQERNRKAGDAVSKKVWNKSNATVKLNHTIENKTWNSELDSQEVGVAVTVGFKAKIRHGNDNTLFGQELEFSAEVSSHYDKYKEKSSGSERVTTDNFEVSIPAQSGVEILATNDVADVSQKVTVVGEVEFDIVPWSDGDWTISYTNSIFKFNKLIQGLYPESYGPVEKYTRNNPSDELEPLETTLEYELEYKGAKTGNITLKEVPLT